MGFIIFLIIAVIILVIVMWGVAGFAAIGLISSEAKAHKKAEANAEAILDERFQGNPTMVVFKLTPRTPKYETVIQGARQRGYRLTHESAETSNNSVKNLIFEKIV